jgi:NAD(P)-dependent dehydrogenase (short-subunit alcohol dehydrogenase family)
MPTGKSAADGSADPGRERRTGEKWTEADVPDQAGRTAVITGANTGLGFETARVLAERGARVVIACRDAGKAAAAARRISTGRISTGRISGGVPVARGASGGRTPDGGPDLAVLAVRLDLASLASVREAAGEILSACDRIDLLINNAGVMMTPYGRTADGFETQLGINHLGHFALTGLLLGRMLDTPGSRVVTVSSNNHKKGRIDFDDLQSERRYRRMAAYGQSKLANLMFTCELQRRLDAAGAPVIATAAHPGMCRTELGRNLAPVSRAFYVMVERPFAQSPAIGALSVLRAATDPAAGGGAYYGPDGRGEERGYPRQVMSSERARDVSAQRRLWRESERLTGVGYPV